MRPAVAVSEVPVSVGTGPTRREEQSLDNEM